METAKEICPTTTMKKLSEGAILVDVRENDEVNELSYDVPHLIHIPLSEFEDRFNEVPKDKEVILVCRSGGRSLKATYFLMNHGWTNVYNMQHGLIRWVQKGFPTIGNTGAVASTGGDSCCSNGSSGSSCC